MTRRVPVGPVSLITPFNFPLNLVAHKVAPAIAAGCPFVLKPSERTPIGAAIIGEVLAETDLPDGAFSVVPCLLEHVTPFIEDPRFALLSFTGSDKVGWALKARAGKKKVVLELGGNAAVIVDGDQGDRLGAVAERIAFGAFYQSGQSCISVQRIFAHEAIHDELRARLVAETKKWTLGDPKDESTMLGPLIDEASARRLESWVGRAVEHGARLLAGGRRTGTMMEATLLEDVPAGEPIVDEEAFGPVAILTKVRDRESAFEKVNASRFGLQAGIYTGSLAGALDAWDALEVGGVVVGDVPSFRVDSMPYGGVKDSGLGREGVRWAMADMTEERLLVIRG
jgi:acyl-CoA reductase-like NAD-dependent aldehyde dehydrogenase